MATEAISKLQPNRTMSLRGFDRRGAAASLHAATSASFKCSGVFRDTADFAVVNLWDADNFFEHYSMRHLPDFDFAGVTASFDIALGPNLQGIDSPKNPWIAWDVLSCRKDDDSSAVVKLWDQATLQSGSFSVASAAWSLAGTPAFGDRLTLFYLDIPFDYEVPVMSAALTYYAQGTLFQHTITITGYDLTITNATNATPINITTSTAHGLTTFHRVRIKDVLGNTAANGLWFVTVVDSTNFTLDSSVGNGAYTGGGKTGRMRSYSYFEGILESGREVAQGIANSVTTGSDPWLSAAAAKGNPITNATNASPIAVTMTSAHGLSTGNSVLISGVGGNAAANNAFIITVTGDTTFTLDGSNGSGAYTSGGQIDRTNVCFFSPITTDGVEIYLDDETDGGGNVTLYAVGLSSIRDNLINQVNNYAWPTEAPTVALLADNPSGNDIQLKCARYGTVNTSSATVTWASGDKFVAIADDSKIHIAGIPYTVDSVTNPTTLTLTSSAGTQTGVRYLAERGGDDGNMVQVQCRSKTTSLTTSGASAFGAYYQNNQKLSGGSSDVSWRVSLDFTGLGIAQNRKSWLTLAPKLANCTAHVSSDFEANFSNWTFSDPSNKLPLKIAGPGSIRVAATDDWVNPTGSWTRESGFYYQGYALASKTTNDKLTIRYSCQYTHDLYIGTSLYLDRGKVGVKLDYDTETEHDLYLNEEPAIITRRKVRSSVPSGTHLVEFRVKGTKNALSTDYWCYLDFVEAVVASDVQDPAEVYTNVSAALDYDTDHTYKLPPQRVAWNLDKLGLRGGVNLYEGVFFWNQRKRVSGTTRMYDVQFDGTWAVGDHAIVTISGVNVRKTLRDLDVDAGDATVARKVLAQSIADRINTTFVGVWAEVVGTGLDTLRVHMRSQTYSFTKATSKSSASGTITETGNLDAGSEGIWEIDKAITPYLNKGAKEWLQDFMSEVAAKAWALVVAFSMELLNPPENPSGGEIWAARYNSGTQVLTATGFGTEALASITGATNASPIVITAEAHGYATGDSITISGISGNSAANGTWTVTKISDDTYSLDGSSGNGTYTSGGQSLRNLKTTHCSFVTDVAAYQKEVYKEIAGMMVTAGLTPWLQYGEFLWWFFSDKAFVITNVSNASPIEITTSLPHGLSSGNIVIVAGVLGNTAANGTWTITYVSSTKFTLNSSIGNGTYQSGTGRCVSGSMGYYDSETTSAAATALGHALRVWNTQDDDPNLALSDASFLRSRLKAHIDTITGHVVATYAGAKFELLYPNDVNYGTAYFTSDFPYPQGGRLNRYVNLPTEYYTKVGSGLDRIKMEGLSWGSFYRNIDKAKETYKFPYTAPLSWALADVRALIPWFNGGCGWEREYLFVDNENNVPTFWAFDHLCLLSWKLPLPVNKSRSKLT